MLASVAVPAPRNKRRRKQVSLWRKAYLVRHVRGDNVPSISPSPWVMCESPTENRAPATCTCIISARMKKIALIELSPYNSTFWALMHTTCCLFLCKRKLTAHVSVLSSHTGTNNFEPAFKRLLSKFPPQIPGGMELVGLSVSCATPMLPARSKGKAYDGLHNRKALWPTLSN